MIAVPVALFVAVLGLIAAKAATPAPPQPAQASEQSEADDQSGPNDQQPSYKSSVTVDENADGEAALAGKAKISAATAQAHALKAHPGTVVGKAQLEDENGNVVYGVEIKGTDGKTYDVKVDAGNGNVLSAEAGDGAESGAGQPAGSETDN